MVADELSVIFSALADPTRRAILTRLRRGEATVTALAEPFAISLPAVSRHLKVLEGAGLIERAASGPYRPSRLNAAPLVQAGDWIATCRAVWDERFDRLDHHLRELQRADTTHSREEPQP